MKRYLSLLCFMVMLTAQSAFGSVAVRLSNEELAKKADEIVIGRVKDISYVFDEKQKTPYTITTIAVERWIKGESKEREIKVRQLGGRFKEQQLFITGDARLNQDEKVLLFLTKGEEFRFILALSQAKFSVIKDEKTGEEKVVRDISQLGLGRFDNDGKLVIEKAIEKDPPLLLKDFIKEIETYLKK